MTDLVPTQRPTDQLARQVAATYRTRSTEERREMKTPASTFPIYADVHGETWRPADATAYGRDWLRCVETERGARNFASVAREFGPLTVRDAGPNCAAMYRDPASRHVHSCAREAHSPKVVHWNGQDSWGRRQWLDDDPEAVRPIEAVRP